MIAEIKGWLVENKYVIVNILLTDIWLIAFPASFICNKWLLVGFAAFSINLVNIVHGTCNYTKEGEQR